MGSPMAEIRTMRVPRTWWDKLVLWKRAFETEIFDSRREVRGRGRTPEASRETALAKCGRLQSSSKRQSKMRARSHKPSWLHTTLA
jgi:hypothetical protein